jgi:predicted ATP-dependent endonuclease of OLD family
MFLERVVIEDFKSIKKLNLTLHDITCLVGKNESGKSSILDAISHLNYYNYILSADKINKNSKRYDLDKLPTITGYFLLDENDLEYLERTIPFKFDEKGKSIENKFSYKWLRMKVEDEDSDNIEIEFIYGNNKSVKLRDKVDSEMYDEVKEVIFEELIPNIELFTNDSLTIKALTFEELIQPSSETLSFRRLFHIGGINDLNVLKVANVEKLYDRLTSVNEQLTELLQKNYKQDKSLRVEITYVGDKFLLKFKDDSKRSYNLSDRSVGFQYFFAFLINKTFLNSIEDKQNIFLLDEPGVSLHPEGARDLIKIFEEIVKKDQIIYTTHNPFLVYRNKPDNLILVKKGNDGTELITKVYTNKYQILRKELGLLLNDSFLVNDFNLVVEGNADKYILHYLIHEEENLEALTWIHIYSADTATEVVPSVRYLDSLGLKGLVLLDSDDAGLNEINKPKFKIHIIDKKNWNFLTLNEILKDKNKRTIEDMIDQSGYLTAYNNYYKFFADTVDWKKEFEPIQVKKYKIPVLDSINIHFKEFADGGINKIAVFREFTKLFPYSEHKEKYIDLINILLLIKDGIIKL